MTTLLVIGAVALVVILVGAALLAFADSIDEDDCPRLIRPRDLPDLARPAR
jgi:hypothetical protein